MATGNPLHVDEWAKTFTAHWKPEQFLDPKFAITFGHCKLCDDQVARGHEAEHMQAHKVEYRSWKKRMRREAAKRSQEGLAAARREKKLQREMES